MKAAHQNINADSGDAEYYTPAVIIEAARYCLQGIDLDPSSCETANARVKARRYFTKEDDGLSRHWLGTVWMNHPFQKGANHLWINKLLAEYHAARTSSACCITFASTSEKWFQPLLQYPQCFLSGRTNYLRANGAVKKGATKGSVVTYIGNNPSRFAEAFQNLGVVKARLMP